MSGFIKLYRGWRNTDGLIVPKHFSEFEAWLWLLENATWKDTTRWNAKGEEIRLKPGQIHVSLRSLATAWGWHESSVRRFLVRLEKAKKAAQLRAQSGTILTIENWSKYQSNDTANDTANDTDATQPRHTQEEGKELKETKNPVFADLPGWIPVDDWLAFRDMRKVIKKPMTDRAVELAILKLDGLRADGYDLTAVLQQSTLNCWQDLFPLRRETRAQEAKIGI